MAAAKISQSVYCCSTGPLVAAFDSEQASFRWAGGHRIVGEAAAEVVSKTTSTSSSRRARQAVCRDPPGRSSPNAGCDQPAYPRQNELPVALRSEWTTDPRAVRRAHPDRLCGAGDRS